MRSSRTASLRRIRRWLDVAFCSICGANLGFTLEAAPGMRTLPAGAFDDPAWIEPE